MVIAGYALVWCIAAAIWGGHVLIPERAARSGTEVPNRWRLVATLLAAVSGLGAIAWLQLSPDLALAAGLRPGIVIAGPMRWAFLLGAVGFAADVALFLGGRALTRTANILLAVCGAIAAAGLAFGVALTQRSGIDDGSAAGLLAQTLFLLALTVAAGETLRPRPHSAAWLGALGVLGALIASPAPMRHAVLVRGDWITALAAAVLFGAAALLPARLQRACLVAAVLMSGLYLGRALEISTGFDTTTSQGPES